MRYLPLTDADRRDMLAAIGVGGIDDLFADVPESARLDGLLDLPRHAGELEVERRITAMARQNLAAGAAPFFLGAGAYRHHVPAAVDALIQRGEFLTAYTPYQPEISQGTLQALFEFQTQVALITGMDVANASMYDGSTACAEAVLMAGRVTKRRKALLSGGLHPHYGAVVRTHAQFIDLEVIENPPAAPSRAPHGTAALEERIDEECACVVVQYPDLFGVVRDFTAVAKACHAAGALLVMVVCEPVALGALMAPGDMGTDIVVGEGQGLGVGLNFGGPYLGLFATRDRYVRQMPGRIAGETTDAEGRRGWVLTLSAREQHIRRERATSNICTNSGLCALAFTIHLALLGEDGFARLARLNHAKAVALADRIDAVAGAEVLNGTFFNEFTVRLARPAAAVVEELAARGILAGVPVSRLHPDRADMADLLLVTATETNTPDDADALTGALAEAW
ncbi:MAG: aminomethyl-transferring glycine dehydrogenase subunit GcvPA [Alphaproteobacteria bacterium]|jgi:glycine dehydrogenase subunit 1|nr:aminomethyl-transferring glycine dehydrogenase subunit GcvPA [Alphaproteobacteria bacterium]